MSLFKTCLLYFIMFNILAVIHCLVELQTAADNNIAATEAIIRNTVNDLFSSLRFKDVNRKPRLKQFSTIHNFFASLTLRDHDNLNEIVRLTRQKHIDNTSIVTKPLNELLNEDNNDETNDETVTLHVETFLKKLKDLKAKYNVNNLSRDTIVNEDILKILENKHFNSTNEVDINNGDLVMDSNEFWRESGRRIYKGTTTKSKYFPFMASVQFFNQFQCAGSIIKSDLVITAASCLQLAYNNRFFRENPMFLSVTVGSTFYQGGGENIPVMEVYFHPAYNPKNLVNNLALMRLLRRLNFKVSKRVKKIDFDRTESPLPDNTEGITIIGWGAKGTSNILADPWVNRLSFAVLDFYPWKECREVYSREYVKKTNFCAGFLSKGGGACNRDVGGPGIVNGLLAGVISFGSPVCGAPDAPTVFTKLGTYTDWIEEIMEQVVPIINQMSTRKPNRTEPTLRAYYSTEPTTFAVVPVSIGRMKPSPELADYSNPEPSSALRLFEDSDIFKKFLATMFNSEEIKEYNDLMDSITKKAEEKVTTEPSKEVTEVSAKTTTGATIHSKQHYTIQEQIMEPVTKLDVYDVSQEAFTKFHNSYAAINKHASTSNEEDNFEKDIVELFDYMDATKIKSPNYHKDSGSLQNFDSLPNLDESQSFDDSVKDIVELLDSKNLLKMLDRNKKGHISIKNNMNDTSFDDSLLALLSQTDSEKKIQDDEYSGEGLSIPMQSLKSIILKPNITGDDSLESQEGFIKPNITGDDSSDSQEGLSIPMQSFKDMTFRQNSTGSD